MRPPVIGYRRVDEPLHSEPSGIPMQVLQKECRRNLHNSDSGPVDVRAPCDRSLYHAKSVDDSRPWVMGATGPFPQTPPTPPSFDSDIKAVSVPCVSIRLILKSHLFVPAISSEIRFYPVRASSGLQQGIGNALRIVPDAPDSENEMDTDDLDGTFPNGTSDGMSTVIPGHRSVYRPSTSSLSRNR